MGRLLDIGKPRQRPASGIRHGRDVVIALFSASSADAGVSRSSPSSPQKIRKPSRNVLSRREEAAEESFVFNVFGALPPPYMSPGSLPTLAKVRVTAQAQGLPPRRVASLPRDPSPTRGDRGQLQPGPCCRLESPRPRKVGPSGVGQGMRPLLPFVFPDAMPVSVNSALVALATSSQGRQATFRPQATPKQRETDR